MAMHNPLQQFALKRLIPLEWCGIDVSFTNASLFMLLAVVVPVVLAALCMRKRLHRPSRLQAACEMPYVFVQNLLHETNGIQGKPYFSLIFSLFLFVLFGNALGMIPYGFTFTSHICVTLALALFVFGFVTAVGFMKHGVRFFSLFVPYGTPWWIVPLVVPIEVLSYVSRPISMSVRLFANMMAGHTMMKVFGSFAVMLGIGGIAPAALLVVLTGFEFLVAGLQAYVFTILSCLYLRDAIALH